MPDRAIGKKWKHHISVHYLHQAYCRF